MNERLIYRLSCPFTNQVHYVGKSIEGMIRPLSHLSKSHSDKINEWVGELKQLGHAPTVEVCEYVPMEVDIDERERYWITKYLNKGNVLLNIQSTHPLTIIPDLEAKLNDGDDFIRTLSTFIKERRKQLGYNQVEFADRAGVGLRWLRDVEQCVKGKNNSVNHILYVLSMFGCTLDIKKIEV